MTGSMCLIATLYLSVVAGESRAFLEPSHFTRTNETVMGSAAPQAPLFFAVSVRKAARTVLARLLKHGSSTVDCSDGPETAADQPKREAPPAGLEPAPPAPEGHPGRPGRLPRPPMSR
jgi:hypothetical protein